MMLGMTNAWAQTTTLLEYGTGDVAWTAENLADWTAGGTPTIKSDYVEITGGNGSYETSKAIAPTANAIINVQAVWRGCSNTGRAFSAGNGSYFRFGNIIVAQNDQDKKHGYGFAGLTNIGSVTTFTAGSYRTSIENCAWILIEMEINTASNTLTSFTIKSEDGETTYASTTNVALADADYTTVAFGYRKSGSVSTTNTEDLKYVKITQTTQDVETADYTVKYVCDDADVKEAATRTGVVGQNISLNASDTENFYANDQKYIYVSNDVEGKTIAENAVVTITFRKAEKFAWTAKSNVGSYSVSGETWEGDKADVKYPLYVLHEGFLWTKAAINQVYGQQFDVTENNQEFELVYSETDIDAIFYAEGEEIRGMSVVDNGNAAARSSQRAAGYSAEGNTLITNLGYGKYKFNARFYSPTSAGGKFNFFAGARNIWNAETSNANATDLNTEVVIAKDSKIEIGQTGATACLDFIYIQNLGDPTTEEYDAAVLADEEADAAAALAAAKTALQEAITAAKAIETEGKNGAEDLATAITTAETALAAEGATVESLGTAKTTLEEAVSAFNAAQPIIVETDLTAQFSALTDWTKWVGATGYTATEFCPAVAINDGTTKQVCEKYETTCNSTGDVFYQTITGLTAGTYKIELYGGAAFTYGRGFGSMAFTGETGTGDVWGTHSSESYTDGQHIDENTGVKLYAITSEGTFDKEIPIYYAGNFPNGAATVVLDGVVVGSNGELKIGMNKTSQSTNWHVVQLKGVTAMVDLVELHANELAAAKAALNAEENAVVTGAEKTNLETAIEANATVAEHTADAYQAAIKALSDATAAFKAAKAAYEGYVAAQAYLVDLPYAKAEKKPVAEAAANATDAAAKAEALLIALRSYYESNALAEGVEGAKIATDSIKNANAEDGINNWTVVLGEGSGGNIDVKSNEPWTDAAGVAEHKYFDGGDWGAQAWDVALEQKIALPAGKYMLTTIARAEKDVDFTLYAGVDSVKIAAISSVGGVFNRGWNNASVEFKMAEADSIVIGVRGVTEKEHNWMSFSDFRLVKFPSDEPVEPQYSGPVTVTWAMGETTTGVANPEANATAIAYAVGTGLTENGTFKYGDITLSKFDQNTGDNKGTNDYASATSLNKYVDFTFTPVGGDFTPTKVSFDIVKNGTGDPNIFVDVIDGKGATINVAVNVGIVRNNETKESTLSYDVSGAASSDKAVTLRILVGKLASGKSVGIANVKIEGNLISASAPVFAATKEVTLKANPFRKTIETTITLTGKNLKNGTYQVPATNVPGLTIAPAEFTVAEGILNQELTLTYAPQEDVQNTTDKLTFTVGELTAETAITYEARLTPLELAIVGEAKTWDWEKLTETIELNETTAPSKTDEFVFAELADQINFGEFDATSIMISNTVYPVRNMKFQNGTIKFETAVPGVITVDFSDTGSSGDNPAKRYLCINGEYQNLKTVDADNKLVAIKEEVYTQRDGTSDRKVSPTIYVAAGMVSINGWDPEGAVLDEAGTPTGEKGVNTAICIYKVTFTPKEGVDTGIMELNAEKNAQTIYNLSGQKLQKVQKGLYIINGKKTIVR